EPAFPVPVDPSPGLRGRRDGRHGERAGAGLGTRLRELRVPGARPVDRTAGAGGRRAVLREADERPLAAGARAAAGALRVRLRRASVNRRPVAAAERGSGSRREAVGEREFRSAVDTWLVVLLGACLALPLVVGL